MSIGERIVEQSKEKILEIANREIGGVCLFEYINDSLKILYVNSGYKKITNFTDASLEPYTADALRLLNNNDAMKLRQFFNQSCYTKAPFETIARAKIANNKRRWQHFKAIPLHLEEGEEVEGQLFLGLIQDITRLKQTEGLLDSILNSSNSGIFRSTVINGKNTVVYANDNFFKIRECSHKAFREDYGNDTEGFIFPEDLPHVKEIIDDVISNHKENFSVNMRIKTAKGNIIWLRSNGNISYGEEGEFFVTGVDYDVTAEVEALEKLNAKNIEVEQISTKLQSIVNKMPGAVFTLEVDDKIIARDSSDGLWNIINVSKEEYYTNPDPLRCIPAKMRQEVRDKVLDAAKNNKDFECVFPIEGTGTSEHNRRWALAKGQIVEWRDKTAIFYVVITDITYQVREEEETRLNEERLKIAFKQSNFVIREYDYQTKELKQISFDEHNKYVEKDAPDSLIRDNVIHPVSHEDYLKLFEKLRNGAKVASVIIKEKTRWDTKYQWYKLNCTNVFDNEGNPYKAIGTMENINDSKEAMDRYHDEQQYRELVVADAIHTFNCDLTYNSLLSVDNELLFKTNTSYDTNYVDFINAYVENLVTTEWRDDFLALTNRGNLAKDYNEGKRLKTLDYQSVNNSGEIVWHRLNINLIKSASSGNICAFCYIRDISDLKEQEVALHELAERDRLTYFYNRETCANIINPILAQNMDKASMVVLSLSNLRELNEKYGHAFTDSIIKNISEKIMVFDNKDTVIGRVTNSNFLIFTKKVYSEPDIVKRVVKLYQSIKDSINAIKEVYELKFSFGIAFATSADRDFEKLLLQAEQTAFQARGQGNGGIKVYGKTSEIVVGKELQKSELIDELDNPIYIVSLQSNNVLYANSSAERFFKITGKDYTGAKCYNVLYDRKSVCEFCPRQQIKADKFTAWENYNVKDGRYYTFKAKAIVWNGVPSLIITATDSTEKTRFSQELQTRIEVGDAITDSVKKSLETHNWVEGTKVFCRALLDFYDGEQGCAFLYYKKTREIKLLAKTKSVEAQYKEDLPWESIIFSLHKELKANLEDKDAYVYTGNSPFITNNEIKAVLSTSNVDNLCIRPFVIKKGEVYGGICVCNSNKTFTNLEFINKVGYFVQATITNFEAETERV